jgi:hypothetical protein
LEAVFGLVPEAAMSSATCFSRDAILALSDCTREVAPELDAPEAPAVRFLFCSSRMEAVIWKKMGGGRKRGGVMERITVSMRGVKKKALALQGKKQGGGR